MLYMLIQFVVIFLIVFGVYYFLLCRKQKNNKEVSGIIYLKNMYHLDLRKVNRKRLGLLVAIINAFIIALTSCIISLFESFIIQLIVGFLLILGLIIVSYDILGRSLRKKESKDV